MTVAGGRQLRLQEDRAKQKEHKEHNNTFDKDKEQAMKITSKVEK